MLSDELQLWISKLSQFESELERLHVALSLPQIDPVKYELMRKLADIDVPKAISKIQAKIAELQPPKPPAEAPPAARGRRPRRSSELSVHHSSEFEKLNSQHSLCDHHQNFGEIHNHARASNGSIPDNRIAASDYIENMQSQPVSVQGKRHAMGTSSLQTEKLQGNLESLYLTGDKTNRLPKYPSAGATNVISQPGSASNNQLEWAMFKRKQEENIGRNADRNYAKPLVSKLDLRDQTSHQVSSISEEFDKVEEGQTRNKTDANEYGDVQGTRSFRKASSDGRIQLSYLAELTQHELYQ